MKDAHNDHNDTWISIGLQANLILNKLRCQAQLTELELAADQKEQSDRDTARGRTEKENSERHREYVDRRLADLRAFEDRMRGKRKQV